MNLSSTYDYYCYFFQSKYISIRTQRRAVPPLEENRIFFLISTRVFVYLILRVSRPARFSKHIRTISVPFYWSHSFLFRIPSTSSLCITIIYSHTKTERHCIHTVGHRCFRYCSYSCNKNEPVPRVRLNCFAKNVPSECPFTISTV